MPALILVVEDEQIVAADTALKLERLGHTVVGTAASGKEAIEIARQFRPEIVLMDIRLQGEMSGIEAGRAIQRETGAPIIFLTAYASVFLRDPSQMQPPGICLSKPFSQYQLQTALDAILKQSSADQSS